MIIEKVVDDINNIVPEGRAIDYIRVTHDLLEKPHQKLTTENGKTIKISLIHGENLYCGAILLMNDEELVVVDLLEEKVFELKPSGNLEWAKTAFNIGNMHQKAYLYDDCIRVPYDYVLEKMIESLGVEYSIEMRKLDGIKANASVASTHSHE